MLVPITTKRLTIAPPSHFEMNARYYVDDLFAIYSDPDVRKYLNIREGIDKQYLCDLMDEECENWDVDGRGLCLAVARDINQVVGIVKVQQTPLEPPHNLEIVCAIHPNHRNDRYAYEMVHAAMTREFDNGTKVLIGRVNPDNKVSPRLLAKLGFDFTLCYRNGWGEVEHVYERSHIKA
jgi:RimJ/RimL family protein N-acetyltransferase